MICCPVCMALPDRPADRYLAAPDINCWVCPCGRLEFERSWADAGHALWTFRVSRSGGGLRSIKVNAQGRIACDPPEIRAPDDYRASLVEAAVASAVVESVLES